MGEGCRQGVREEPLRMSSGFDRLARWYRWMELLSAGETLQRCRTEYLDEVRSARRVLVVGEGNGRFLCELVRANPGASVLCLDESGEMLRRARQRLHRRGLSETRVRFVQEDVRRWEPSGGDVDLVVTHFFLDCFPIDQLESVVGRISKTVGEGAQWLLADFQAPASGWRRVRARLFLRIMYAFFRIATRLPAMDLVDPDPVLKDHGFRLCSRRVSEWGLLRSDLWQREGPCCFL